jgi:predicted Zn-dependent protease
VEVWHSQLAARCRSRLDHRRFHAAGDLRGWRHAVCAETHAEAEAQTKPKPKPKPKDSKLNDDQIYSVGYWQAKDGEHAAALATLRTAANPADPRIQTMIGFSLRKLGRVDEAMEYYQKVLAAYPDRTTTRQYLGEAFLQIGEPGKAKDQLAEIGKRCGTACEDYQLLADEIAKFEKQAG